MRKKIYIYSSFSFNERMIKSKKNYYKIPIHLFDFQPSKMAIPTITATDYKSETFLNNIYYQMSRLYLSSFSPQIHQSIYHYYTNFMLITHRRAILFIPIKEKICWCLSIYLVIYYFCTSYKWINIDDDTKFLFGDLGNLIAEDSIAASFSISLLAGFASLMFLIIIYYSLHTLSSLGLRTFLLITQSDDPFIFEQIKHQTKQPISRATILTLKILDKKIHLKQQKFRQIFNRVYCIAQFFHGKHIHTFIMIELKTNQL